MYVGYSCANDFRGWLIGATAVKTSAYPRKFPSVRYQHEAAARTRGFTMLELVVVLSIILILMGIGVVNYRSTNNAYKIMKDASSLASLVNAARMKAAASFSRVVIYCDAGVSPVKCGLNYYAYNATTPTTGPQDLTVFLSPGVSLSIPNAATSGAGMQVSTSPSMSGGATLCGATGAVTPYCMIVNSRGLPATAYSGTFSSTATAPAYVFYLTDQSNNSAAVALEQSGNVNVYRLVGSGYKVANN